MEGGRSRKVSQAPHGSTQVVESVGDRPLPPDRAPDRQVLLSEGSGLTVIAFAERQRRKGADG